MYTGALQLSIQGPGFQTHTYELDVGIRSSIDGCPEHVCTKDLFSSLHNKERVPELCVV